MLNWTPILLSLQLASVTTVTLLILSIPLAYWLTYSHSRLRPFVNTLISMPLVLPPTVLGFYLLVAFSPNSFLGSWIEHVFGFSLLFSFEGLVFASIIYSLPFMVQPLHSGLMSIPKNIIDAADVLGSSRIRTVFKILLPTIKTSIITGIVLTFAHTLGEFGVVLMIGGNMPDQTKVASIAIYDAVESMNYTLANYYSAVLFLTAFCILLGVNLFNRGYLNKFINGGNRH